MRTALRKAFLLLLMLVLFGGIGGKQVWAAPQTKSVDVLSRDGDITILPNGDVQVVETWKVRFIGGPFHYAFRAIPLNHVEDITNWQVSENGQPYREDYSGAPGTFVLEKDAEGYQITWYFSYTTDAVRTFTLRYTLKGALWIDDKGDQFFWKFIEHDRSYPIESATVTLHLPAAFQPDQLLTATYKNGREEGTGLVVDSRTIMFRGGPFPGGTEWEIRAQWPHGYVSASPPAWQRKMELQPWIDLGWWLLFILMGIGGAAGGFLSWYLRGRDPKVSDVPSFIPEPPSDIPPGVAGTLIDEKADMDDVLGTLLDLARKGAMRIETEQKPGLFGTNEETWFIAEDPSKATWPFEKALLRAIFGSRITPGERRSLDSLTNRFYQDLPEIQKGLYDAVVKLGFFPSRPDRVRSTYTVLAVLVGLLFACLYFPAAAMGANAAGVAFIVLGAILTVGLLVIAHAMPRKTRKGAIEAAKWKAFKRYLETLEKHTSLESAKDIFEKYLPYATAFGISDTWIRKFSRVPNMPTPGWYTMRPIGHARPTTLGGGKTASPVPTSQGIPSLDQMASGTFTSFSQVADSLMHTLNSAASTFVSQPSSSGGGGGGGGFSGGGFGGGGGGGGSSGFG